MLNLCCLSADSSSISLIAREVSNPMIHSPNIASIPVAWAGLGHSAESRTQSSSPLGVASAATTASQGAQ